MQYQCVHCDETFDYQGEGRPRCPKCMRVHDLRAVDEAAQPQMPSRRLWLWVGAGVAVASMAAAGGYWFWQKRSAGPEGPSEVPMRPLKVKDLTRHLKRRGVAVTADATRPGSEYVGLFEASDGMAAFAKRATKGKGSATKKARAVVEAVRKRALQGASVAWPRIDPREAPPMVAAKVWEATESGSERVALYPLEVATLAVALLRTAGVAAMLAEVHAFPGERAPADPSGRLGYFAVALRPEGENGDDGEDVDGDAIELFDPFGGRRAVPKAGDFKLLTDAMAVGMALNLYALHQLIWERDPRQALEGADAALRLAPRSPTVRGARAMVLLAGGGVAQGISELEAALQIRSDSPRHNNLAILLLADGDVEGAAREVARATKQHRNFASARVTLAGVHLAQMEYDLARAELEEAEKLDAALSTLPLAWAQYYAARGQMELAIGKARRAVELRSYDFQSRMLLAHLYRSASRFDDMRSQARKLLKLAPAGRKAEVKALIRRVLGPTALERPTIEQGDSEQPQSPPVPGAGDFKLRKGSRLLGGDDSPAPGPSLLSDGVGSGSSETPRSKQDGRPLLLSDDPPKLRLRGSKPKLELKP